MEIFIHAVLGLGLLLLLVLVWFQWRRGKLADEFLKQLSKEYPNECLPDVKFSETALKHLVFQWVITDLEDKRRLVTSRLNAHKDRVYCLTVLGHDLLFRTAKAS